MTDPSDTMPDFSGGEDFLKGLRGTLHKRQRRRNAISALATTAGAVLLFFLSFSTLQRQGDAELWEAYLLSEVAQEVDAEDLDAFGWELYFDALIQEDDLDLLLDEILSLDDGEEWIRTLQMKG